MAKKIPEIKQKAIKLFNIAKSKVTALWQKSPHIVFLSAMGGVIVLSLVIVGLNGIANRPQKVISASQTTQSAQQTSQPVQTAQTDQAPAEPLMWQGVALLINGPIAPTAPAEATLVNGDKTLMPLVLTSTDKANSQENVQASVIFPLGGKYQQVSFLLAQNAISGDMSAYAFGTIVEIKQDGNVVFMKDVTKNSLLAKLEPITLNLAGANQLEIKFTTHGLTDNKKTKDQRGPFFSFVLADLKFV